MGERRYRPPPVGVESLTARELECLLWAARGFENPQIAARMGVSRSWVHNLLQSAYGKLGVSDRTQAVVAVLRHVKRDDE